MKSIAISLGQAKSGRTRVKAFRRRCVGGREILEVVKTWKMGYRSGDVHTLTDYRSAFFEPIAKMSTENTGSELLGSDGDAEI